MLLGLVSTSILQPPFHVLRTSEADSHSLFYGIPLFHSVVQYEMWNKRPAHPASAPAVKKDGTVACAA